MSEHEASWSETLPSSSLGEAFRTARLRPRPSLPLLLLCGLASWVGAFLCETLFWHVDGGVRPSVPQAVSCVMALGGLFALLSLHLFEQGRVKTSTTCMCLVFLCAGISCSAPAFGGWEDSWRRLSEDPPSGSCTIAIASDPVAGVYGSRSDAVLLSEEGRTSIRVYWRSDEDIQPAGAIISAWGTPKAVARDPDHRWQHAQGIVGTMTVHAPNFIGWSHTPSGLVAPLRASLCESFANAGEGGALLEGIVTGNREHLRGTELEDAFSTCGLSHLIVVSGSHLAVVSMISMWVCERLRLRRVTSAAATSALLLGYLLLSGLQLSAIRACCMAETGLLVTAMGRRRNAGAALGLAIVLIISVDPFSAFSVSLGLSTLSVLGMFYLSPLFENWLAPLIPRPIEAIGTPIAATLSAQLVTLPVVASLFSRIPLVAPLSNLVAAPLVNLLLLGGLVVSLTLFVLPAVGSLLVPALAGMAALLCQLVRMVARIPYAAVPISVAPTICTLLTCVIIVTLWLLWPPPTPRGLMRVSGLTAASLLLVLMPSLLPVSPRVIALDVGQGDAILLRSGHACMLVDAGRDPHVLEAALARQHVSHLDAVVVTHLHDDHYGGLVRLGDVETDAVYLPRRLLDSYPDHEGVKAAEKVAGATGVQGLSPGDALHLGHITLDVLWPSHVTDDGGNQDSLCLRMSFDADGDGDEDVSGLLCGDAEEEVTDELARDGALGRIDLLKVGHHGSKLSVSDDLLDRTDVRLALISVGEGNRYGHPAPNCLDALDRAGVTTFRTDLSGDVTVCLGPQALSVSCATMGAT